jgi:regulator of RNase E activity RraA
VSASQTSHRPACEGLSAAVLSDTLDALGLIHQVMNPAIRPLDESLVLWGRARTGRFREVHEASPGADVLAPVTEMVDALRPGEVLVLACGGAGRIPAWGELLSTAAQMRGAAGCVTDGLVRDVRQIRQQRFPAFAAGYGAMVTLGRAALISRDAPVHCGGVWVAPGDLVFGDADGVVVVPRGVEEDVLREAARRAAQERAAVQGLREGKSITDVYRGQGAL